MENKKTFGFVLSILGAVIVICLVAWAIIAIIQGNTFDIPKPERTYIGNDVYRFVDEEAGVVCWTYKVWETLTCLPIKDTLLGH
jgi:hypothetical protein